MSRFNPQQYSTVFLMSMMEQLEKDNAPQSRAIHNRINDELHRRRVNKHKPLVEITYKGMRCPAYLLREGKRRATVQLLSGKKVEGLVANLDIARLRG
jgi:hypothetical protein